MMNSELFERLPYEEQSPALDFKRDVGRSSASLSARRRARLRELSQKLLCSFRQRLQPFELDL
jgi:hypothetical protein